MVMGRWGNEGDGEMRQMKKTLEVEVISSSSSSPPSPSPSLLLPCLGVPLLPCTPAQAAHLSPRSRN
jgi:hypothetical protein